MARKQTENNRLKKRRDIERQYEQYFTPLPQILLKPEGSLAQPSPYLNVWGLQASDAGAEPIFVEPSNDRSPA
jgi:hypothetical protein